MQRYFLLASCFAACGHTPNLAPLSATAADAPSTHTHNLSSAASSIAFVDAKSDPDPRIALSGRATLQVQVLPRLALRSDLAATAIDGFVRNERAGYQASAGARLDLSDRAAFKKLRWVGIFDVARREGIPFEGLLTNVVPGENATQAGGGLALSFAPTPAMLLVGHFLSAVAVDDAGTAVSSLDWGASIAGSLNRLRLRVGYRGGQAFGAQNQQQLSTGFLVAGEELAVGLDAGHRWLRDSEYGFRALEFTLRFEYAWQL